MDIQVADWPEELDFVVAAMTPDTVQPVHSFQPAKGEAHTRPAGPAFAALRGEVEMGQALYDALAGLPRGLT